MSTNLYVASHGGGTGGRGWERERKDLLELSTKLLKLAVLGQLGSYLRDVETRQLRIVTAQCLISQ